MGADWKWCCDDMILTHCSWKNNVYNFVSVCSFIASFYSNECWVEVLSQHFLPSCFVASSKKRSQDAIGFCVLHSKGLVFTRWPGLNERKKEPPFQNLFSLSLYSSCDLLTHSNNLKNCSGTNFFQWAWQLVFFYQ